MLEYLLVFLITLVVITASVFLHLRLSVPRYRIERADLRELIEQAVAGQAKVDRWELVTGITIRHDTRLSEWQQRCQTPGEQMTPQRDAQGTAICRFSASGIAALQEILKEMDAAEGHTIERRF